MYLERFETERGQWIQGCINLPFAGGTSAIKNATQEILTVSGIVPQLQLTLRVRVTPDRHMARVMLLSAPPQFENQLRSFISLFSRLEIVEPGSIQLPSTVDAFDSLTPAFPNHCVRLVPGDLRRGSIWFAGRFRAIAHLEELILGSLAAGDTFTYQLSCLAKSNFLEHARAAKRNLLAMKNLVGLPADLFEMERGIVQALDRSTHLLEEHIAFDTVSGLIRANESVRRCFQQLFPMFGQAAAFNAGPYPDLTSAGFHSCHRNEAPTDEICAMAATGDEVNDLISWTPKNVLATRLRTSIASHPPDIKPDPVSNSPIPLPFCEHNTDDRSFAFVSYRRTDLNSIVPSLREMYDGGLPYWIDREIPGGAEWTAELEQKIERCCIVVVFLSQAAVDSKYVRREILMADALNKPILVFRIGEPDLKWGLKLVLSQYQMVPLEVKRVNFTVRRAILAHRSRVV